MITLKIPAEKAVNLINERIDDIKTITENESGLEYYEVIRWCSKTWSVIDEIYDAGDPHPEEIRSIGLSNCSCSSPMAAVILVEAHHAKLLDYIREIRDVEKTPE